MFMNENLSIPFVLETSISEGLYIVLAPSWYIVTRTFNFDFKTLFIRNACSIFCYLFYFKLNAYSTNTCNTFNFSHKKGL